jgi:8-oxo-dGTP pyrophosphatase MutT (NUDIX family)
MVVYMKKSINYSLFSLILAVFATGNALGMSDWYPAGWLPRDSYRVHCSAGILPYAVDHAGNRFFLVGCEQGKLTQTGANVWTDFGGQRDDDEGPVETAAREFSEETRGVLGWLLTICSISDYARIAHAKRTERSMEFIKDQLSVSNPIISVTTNNNKKTHTIYHEYLVEIDYISPSDILKLPFEYGVEKTDYRWVSATDLVGTIPDNGKCDYANVILPHALSDITLRFPFVGLLCKHKKAIVKALQAEPAKFQTIQDWNGPSLVTPPLASEKIKGAGSAAVPVGATTEEDFDINPVSITYYNWNRIYAFTAFVAVLGGYGLYRWLNPKDEADDEEAAELAATAIQ